MPTVSVILPAYNAAAFLPQSIGSVLSQTMEDLEVIVIDDGSKDDTASVMKNFPSVRYVRQANAGVSVARNHGASLARGRYLAFLDADDLWRPEKLQQQVAAMDARDDVLLSRTCYFEAERDHDVSGRILTGKVVMHERLEPSFLMPYFATSTVVVSREAFEKVGGFDVGLRVAEDVDLYLRILALSPVVAFLQDELAYKRIVAGSLGDDSVEGYRQLCAVYERYLADHPHVCEQLGEDVVNQALRKLDMDLGGSLIRRGQVREGRNALRRAMNRGWGGDLAKLWVHSYLNHPAGRHLKEGVKSLVGRAPQP